MLEFGCIAGLQALAEHRDVIVEGFALRFVAGEAMQAATIDVEAAVEAVRDIRPVTAEASSNGRVTTLVAHLADHHAHRQARFGVAAGGKTRGAENDTAYPLRLVRLSVRKFAFGRDPEDV